MTMNKEELRKSLEAAGAIDAFGREVRVARAPVVVARDDGDTDNGERKLQGYAAMFNSETIIGGWYQFRETIQPGAFTKTIKEADVRHLFNHDPNWVLGRNKAGTLRLSEDVNGLAYDVDLNMNDPQAMSVAEKVERGDVNQSSFAFVVIKEQWEEPDDPEGGELPLRTILEAKLYDTSTVTYPAYEDTTALISSASARSALDALGINSTSIRSIANEEFNPDLAPALREVAQRAEQLAVACEGETCPRAAEEAPGEAEERAAEEAPVVEEPIAAAEEAQPVEEQQERTVTQLTIIIDSKGEVTEVTTSSEDDTWQKQRRKELFVREHDIKNQAAKALTR